MDVSIIIVAWNVKQLLHDCLKSVYDQTRDIEFEVIYVDNASEDGSVEIVERDFSEVIIIENDENQGFIKANNQAIKIAEGRYVLLLNSDTIILDNAISKTVEFADAHPEAAVVGCRVLNPDMTLQRTCVMYHSPLNLFLSATYLYKLFPRNKFFGREAMTWWDFDDVREVETVSGCFSLVRTKAIEQVGLMDPIYFVYGDDPDWCYRFKKEGWKIMFTSEPNIIHYGGQTTKHMAREFSLQCCGSILIFIKKHKGTFAFYLARIFLAIFFLLRVPYWLATGLIKSDERGNAFNHSKTYLMGAFYCLSDWKNLLMNKEEIEQIL